MVDDISYEGLRILLREEGVSFQRIKTWKISRDSDYAAKKARIEHLYAIADGEVIPDDGEPEVVLCMDEFGPLNLQPTRAGSGPSVVAGTKTPSARPGRGGGRPHGVRHVFAAYDLAKGKLYGHIKKTKNRSKFLEFCRYLRSLYPPETRIAIVCDNYSPHLTTERCRRVADWAEANNIEIAYTPTNSSYLNRIEAQFHRPALLRPGRHRPPHPQGPGQHDPSLHHLAEQTRHRRTPTQYRQQDERRLMRIRATRIPKVFPDWIGNSLHRNTIV